MEEKLDRVIELLENGEIIYWLRVLIVTIILYLLIRLAWIFLVSKGGWKK